MTWPYQSLHPDLSRPAVFFPVNLAVPWCREITEMSFTILPSENLVTKMVPLLCRIVGIAFIMGGIFELILIPILFLGEGENVAVVVVALSVSAIFSIGVGIVIIKYFQKIMLALFQKIRENPPF